MDKEHIELGIRGIEDLRKRRDKLNKEISELTKILNKELIDLIEFME